MPDSISKRILLAHLGLNATLQRKVTQAELGAMVGELLGRSTPFSAAAVSRWEAGTKLPGPVVIEAIALATHTDPGWISHGSKSAAPAPQSHAALWEEIREGAATPLTPRPKRNSNPQILS